MVWEISSACWQARCFPSSMSRNNCKYRRQTKARIKGTSDHWILITTRQACRLWREVKGFKANTNACFHAMQGFLLENETRVLKTFWGAEGVPQWQTIDLTCPRQSVWFPENRSHQYAGVFMTALTLETLEEVWLHVWQQSGWLVTLFLLLFSRPHSLISGCKMRFLSWQLCLFKLLSFPSETMLKMLLTLSSLHMPICCSLQQIPFLATEYSFSVQCVFIYPLSFPLILSRQPSPLFACFTHESLVEFPSHSSLFLEEFATLCHPLKKTFINFVFWQFCTGIYVLWSFSLPNFLLSLLCPC